MSAITTWHPSLGTDVRPTRARRTRQGLLRRWAPFLAGLTAVAALTWWVTNSQIFDLRDLRVSGNSRLSSDQVASLAGITPGTNLMWASPGSIERRLEGDPWIARATVSRTLPSTMRVVIRERTPVAIVAGTSLLMASDGTILGQAEEGTLLPRVAGRFPEVRPGSRLAMSLPQLAAVSSMPPELQDRVARVFLTPDGTVGVKTRDGIQVTFGNAGRPAEKWEVLGALLAWARRNDVVPAYIDVRSPRAPAVRPAH